MTQKTWREAKPILVFNRKKVLALIAKSLNEASKYSHELSAGNMSKVCRGELISLGTYYFRYIDPEIEIDLSDIGVLTLEEYDELCGVKRPVYANTKMSRKKWKYRKHKTIQNEN